MYAIGIDPGLGGAIAALDRAGEVVWIHKTPTLEVQSKSSKQKRRRHDLAGMKRILEEDFASGSIVGLEEVHAIPAGVAGISSVAMFSFGRGLGDWEGLLVGMGIRYQFVGPRRWQAAMLRGETDKGKPGAYLAATRLFPDVKNLRKGSGEVDALLIAEYTRREFVLAGVGPRLVEGEAS